MARASVQLSPREQALRKQGEARLKLLRNRSEKYRRHLESDRGRNDAAAMFRLLHQVEVEYNDLLHNLKKPDYVPKAGKPQRDKPAKQVPAPQEIREKPKGGQPAPSKYAIPKPVPVQELDNMGRGEGRSWCSAPLVEAELPITGTSDVLRALSKFAIEDESRIVRSWAESTFGSIELARDALRAGAMIQKDVDTWRGILANARNPAEFENMSDDELLEHPKAARVVRILHGRLWIEQTVSAIKKSAKGSADLDTLDRRVRGALKSFHTAVNSGKHTNPQFSYLSLQKPTVEVDQVRDEVLAWLDLPDEERYERDDADDRKRHRITVLQKELGKAQRAKVPRGPERKQRWGGRQTVRGMISKSREGVLLWDTTKQTNGLVFALPVAGHKPIDAKRYLYIDGRPLASDKQLVNESGKGKSCLNLPLDLKHDFLRWYAKHVENHLPAAPLHRRCQQKSLQFVIVEPESEHPRLFIRPIFKFYESGSEVGNTHEPYKRPACRYLVGIDVGINYVLRAVVCDTKEMKIVKDYALQGRKEEWRSLREALAYHYQRRDHLRAKGASTYQIDKQVTAIRALRKKDRGLGHTEAVEAVARLIEELEGEYGPGNYCIVMEDLAFGAMNLKRNNRVKHLAAIRDAVTNQLRKRGYRYREKSGKVDGLRFELPHYTSQVSPFGWWAKPAEVDAVWKKDRKPIGRKVGNWFERRDDDKPCRRGSYERPNGRGRPRFVVEDADRAPEGRRRSNFGSELFWDPHCRSCNGASLPCGIVLDADFVGAFNLAVRPLVKDGKGKGFTAARQADAHVGLNPTVRIACPVPAFEVLQDEKGNDVALRRRML